MKEKFYAGTVAMSVWSTDDLGETWFRPNSEFGMTNEARIWSISSHEDEPNILLAGTNEGLFRWREDQVRWESVSRELDGLRVWAVAHSPYDSKFILVGLSPGAVMRSLDGGRNWEKLPLRIPKLCMFDVISRVTQIKFDPIDPDTIWVSVEIDAIWKSTDRGNTWQRLSSGLVSDDAHGIEIVRAPQGRLVFVASNKGLFVSEDDGSSFTEVAFETPRAYTRSIVASAKMDGTMFLSNGDGPPGSWGRLYRSTDWGKTWERIALDPEPNSTIWTIAINKFNPDLIFCCSNLGHIYRSTDHGQSFVKLPRELGEIRSSWWRPVNEN